ncbi:g6187 [Coccomyxa viridis]|uniref:G6187 protein n=1 Tax=Coccomyxa viridis TaxID=1274662 RepID=A0ABP1FUS8_9CHLO
MELIAAPRARKPSQLGKVQGIWRKAPASSMNSSSLSTVAVPAQLSASSEASARAARQARRDQMREASSSELYTRGKLSEHYQQQQQQQRQAADASQSAQDAKILQAGSNGKAGVATRARAARTAQALAEQPQQPAAHACPQDTSRERSAGSPEPRVTRSSARAAQAQRRHHPYMKPSTAAASPVANHGPAVQTRSALRHQQCNTQDAERKVSISSGPITRSKHLCVLEQQRSAPVTAPPGFELASDAAPSRAKLRAGRPAGRQAGADVSDSAARRACVENLAGFTPVTAAQRAESAPSIAQRCKRPRDTAEAQTGLSERPGPVTRSRGLFAAQTSQTEPHAPAPACSAAQHSMQLRARKPTERQAGADGTSSAARRTLRSRGPVQPDPSRLTPPVPTPAQQSESAPSRAQGGKRLRNIVKIATPDVEDPALGNGGGGKGQSLESAEHSGMQPDLAFKAPRSAKRARLASPEGVAGLEAAVPAACSASAMSQSHRGAQKGSKVRKQTRLLQTQGPVPQHVPSVPQQTAVAAALQEAPAALQEPMLAQQAPAAAQDELDASQAPYVTSQGPSAAQKMPAPAQPAPQQEQDEAVATPARAIPTARAAPVATGTARSQQQRPQQPSWRPKPDSFLHKQIVKQFPRAIIGSDDEWDNLMILPLPPTWAQRIVRERSIMRGFVDSDSANIHLYRQRWKKPPSSSLSVASGPSEPHAPAPAGSTAQHRMQLRAHKPTDRQAGADKVCSAARRTRAGGSAGLSSSLASMAGQGTADAQCLSPQATQTDSISRSSKTRSQVQRDPSSLAPPTPTQQAESAPSRKQRGKRPRDVAEAGPPDAKQRTALHNGGEGKVEPLEGAMHNSAQPDLAPQAARPIKRSRPATPEDSAGTLASAAAAASDAKTSQPVPGAVERRNSAKSARRSSQKQSPIAQQEPVPCQHAAVAAQQEPAPAQPAAQTGPASAQQEPASAQPALKQDQVEAVSFPATAPPAVEAAPTALGVASARAQKEKPQSPAWTLRGTLLHKNIVRQFSSAVSDRHDEVGGFFFSPASVKLAQDLKAKRSTLRGKVPSGGNFNRHGLKWKKPFRSILSFVSRPSDDPTISLDARIWARAKAKIIKQNGGVEPTASHRRYEDFVRASQFSQGASIPIEW